MAEHWAEASSATAECPICNEDVFSMKILPCKHEFCLTCLVQESNQGEHGRKCPNCREPHNLTSKEIEALPTLYYGQFQCTVCREQEDVIESFWCSECAHLMCRKCTIKHLKSTPGHTTSEWNTLQAVKDCASHSLKMSELKPDATPGEDEKKSIKEFCNNLENQLLEQLEIMKLRSFVNSEVEFYHKVTDLFGKLDLADVSPMPTRIPLEWLQRVAGQILGVTNGGPINGDQETNYFQPLKQKVLKCFKVQPEELAQSLLRSANTVEIEVSEHLMPYAQPLEGSEKTSVASSVSSSANREEIEVSDHLMPSAQPLEGSQKANGGQMSADQETNYFHPLKQKVLKFFHPVNLTFNEQGNLVCTDTFLASVHDQYVFPARPRKFEWWVYKGNGEQLPRLLKIIDKNLHFSREVSLLLGDQFIPVTITQNTNISSLKIEAGDTPLVKQSAKNFSQCITSLIYKAPHLLNIWVVGKGTPVSWMKEVWSHLPSSLGNLGIHKLPLTSSEIYVIAEKYIMYFELGYCSASWESLLQLLTRIMQTRFPSPMHLKLKDYMKDVDIFEKFLQGVLWFKDRYCMYLHFFEFELTEAHWKKLESCLKMLSSGKLQAITFKKMICEQGILENVKELCDQKNVFFNKTK